jgi:hypothetical protein
MRLLALFVSKLFFKRFSPSFMRFFESNSGVFEAGLGAFYFFSLKNVSLLSSDSDLLCLEEALKVGR